MKIKVEKINSSQLLHAYLIREKVFVEEQMVPREEEIDGFENICHHYLAFDPTGKAIGTARWRRTENGFKLERFAILKDFRKMGVGSCLLEEILKEVLNERVDINEQIYLHAQIDAMPLYKKFNFKEQGGEFEECGIMHYKMTYQG
jgi:predicted GNAT family N-acyltransferase